MYQQLLSMHCWDQLEMNLYQERCHASFSPSSCMYLHPTWMDWCSILVILYVAKIMGPFALSLNMQMARVCHLHPEAVQWWLGPHHQDISLGLEQVQCSLVHWPPYQASATTTCIALLPGSFLSHNILLGRTPGTRPHMYVVIIH